jgi:hypothetical protein
MLHKPAVEDVHNDVDGRQQIPQTQSQLRPRIQGEPHTWALSCIQPVRHQGWPTQWGDLKFSRIITEICVSL